MPYCNIFQLLFSSITSVDCKPKYRSLQEKHRLATLELITEHCFKLKKSLLACVIQAVIRKLHI